MTAKELLTEAGLQDTFWGKTIIEAEERGWFTEEDRRFARRGTTCACGKQDPRIPRDKDGWPVDSQLIFLGSGFYQSVYSNLCVQAARTLIKIERRAAEVLAEVNAVKTAIKEGPTAIVNELTDRIVTGIEGGWDDLLCEATDEHKRNIESVLKTTIEIIQAERDRMAGDIHYAEKDIAREEGETVTMRVVRGEWEPHESMDGSYYYLAGQSRTYCVGLGGVKPAYLHAEQRGIRQNPPVYVIHPDKHPWSEGSEDKKEQLHEE